jgi:hypothetical protein
MISRRNALKHGLRATTVPLPGEDPDAPAKLLQDYDDCYRPRGPVAQGLAAACVQATILFQRVCAAHEADAAMRVEEAQQRLTVADDEALEDEVRRFGMNPAAGCAALALTPAGCRWLADAWGPLAQALRDDLWTATDTRGAMSLLGSRTDLPSLASHPQAWVVGVLGALVQEWTAEQLAPLFAAGVQPACTRDSYRLDALPDRAEAVRRLGAVIATERAAHLRAAAALPDPAAEPRARAAARAYLPADSPDARLRLRYLVMAQSNLLRTAAAFTRELAREQRGLDPGYDDAEPSEPEPVPAAAEPAPVPAPNEPRPATAPAPNEPRRSPLPAPKPLSPAERRLEKMIGPVELGPVRSSFVPIAITGRPPVTASR